MNDQVVIRLREFARERDSAVLKDSKLLKATMSDLCPDSKLERHCLAVALEAGVPRRLATSGEVLELLVLQMTAELQDEYGLSQENAIWTVDSWLRLAAPDPVSLAKSDPSVKGAVEPAHDIPDPTVFPSRAVVEEDLSGTRVWFECVDEGRPAYIRRPVLDTSEHSDTSIAKSAESASSSTLVTAEDAAKEDFQMALFWLESEEGLEALVDGWEPIRVRHLFERLLDEGVDIHRISSRAIAGTACKVETIDTDVSWDAYQKEMIDKVHPLLRADVSWDAYYKIVKAMEESDTKRLLTLLEQRLLSMKDTHWPHTIRTIEKIGGYEGAVILNAYVSKLIVCGFSGFRVDYASAAMSRAGWPLPSPTRQECVDAAIVNSSICGFLSAAPIAVLCGILGLLLRGESGFNLEVSGLVLGSASFSHVVLLVSLPSTIAAVGFFLLRGSVTCKWNDDFAHRVLYARTLRLQTALACSLSVVLYGLLVAVWTDQSSWPVGNGTWRWLNDYGLYALIFIISFAGWSGYQLASFSNPVRKFRR